MTKNDCRPGTYPTNGSLVKGLIEELVKQPPFENDVAAFRTASPSIPKPTLKRAESGGCLFQATLEKLAVKLGQKSWKQLLAAPNNVEPPPVFSDPVARALTTPLPFDTFDETEDGGEILRKIELLLTRKIPFLVMAFNPGSVRIVIALERGDALELDRLFNSGAMTPLGITSFERVKGSVNLSGGASIKSHYDSILSGLSIGEFPDLGQQVYTEDRDDDSEDGGKPRITPA